MPPPQQLGLGCCYCCTAALLVSVASSSITSQHPREVALRAAISRGANEPAGAAAGPLLAELAGLLAGGGAGPGRGAEAAAALQAAVKLEPRVPDHHLNLGALRMRRGQVAKAVKSLRKAARLDPAWAAAHGALARALTQLSRTGEARQALIAAVRAEREDWRRGGTAAVERPAGHRLALAEVLLDKTHLATAAGEAMELLQSVIADHPTSPPPRVLLAGALQKLQRLDEAEGSFIALPLLVALPSIDAHFTAFACGTVV